MGGAGGAGRAGGAGKAAVVHTPGLPPAFTDHPGAGVAGAAGVAPAGPGTSLVQVSAAPITPLDLLCAGGTSYFGTPATPYVPGVQGVGRVVTSSTLPAGTRVWFATTAGMAPGDGSLAPHCVVADEDLVPLDDGADDVLVAALGLSAVAAWSCLTTRGRLQPGERVLVLGAGGVVGQVAVQAARLLGATRIVGACRSERAAGHARAAGADSVVPLGTPGPDGDEDVGVLAARFAAALGGAADLVVDPLCGRPASAALEVLAPRGRLVNLGGSAGATATFSSATLRSRSAEILGYTNSDLSPAERAAALREVLRHAAAGRLTVRHEVVPLTDVADAWERQRTGTADGRVVLLP